MTALDVDFELHMLEDVDFEPALPCESASSHRHIAPVDEPASWVVDVMCPDCGDAARVLMCDPCRRIRLRSAARCYSCDGPVHENWLDFVLAMVRIA